MTSSERLGTCLAISIFVHFLLVTYRATPSQPASSEAVQVVCDLAPPVAALSVGDTIAMEGHTDDDRSGAENDLAKARNRYLKAVSDAIHAHRFDYAGVRGCLGTAWFSFAILPDGRFTTPVLRQSSGDPRLDEASALAIRNASGTVPRPRILGSASLALVMAVKYQLGL